MATCLHEHEKDLSPDCKVRIAAANSTARVRKACEMMSCISCKDMKPGGGRIHNCLRSMRVRLPLIAWRDREEQGTKMNIMQPARHCLAAGEP